jgi:hypothetical protein
MLRTTVPIETQSDLLTLRVAGAHPVVTMLHTCFCDAKRTTWMLLIPWRLRDDEIFGNHRLPY